MGKRTFTREQVEALSKNVNVARCSEKSITYDRDFKKRAVRQYNEECLGARQIFRNAGFDLDVIGRQTPKACLRDWNRIYRTKGMGGFAMETRGRPGRKPEASDATDAEKIKRLEAEVAYLKAENDFLAKLRAKRRE